MTPRRPSWPSVLALALLTACPGPSDTPADRQPIDGPPTDTFPQFRGRVPKNIIMISMDTFRRDHLDRYGDGREITPFMSALADAGVALDDHVQCSNWTWASTSCTLLGRYNIEAGHAPALQGAERMPFPDGTPFLASWLKEAGYFSILMSSNSWLGPEWGNAQGYDVAQIATTGKATGVYEQARDLMLAALDTGEVDRWFMHIHLTEPHVPYAPPPAYLGGLQDLPSLPWDVTIKDEHYDITRDTYDDLTQAEQDVLEKHLRVRYEAELAYLDDQIFQIWADLEWRGLTHDALLVFWTDHGEQFWEHGYQSHAYTMYREENDAIAFFWAENIVPAAWDGPTTAIDLAPTILKLQGIDLPDEVTGVPLGEAPDDRARFAWTVARLGPAHMVIKDDLKLTYSWSGTLRAYDLASDPLEQNDIYDPEDPRIQALWDELEPMVQQAEPLLPDSTVNWPEALQD